MKWGTYLTAQLSSTFSVTFEDLVTCEQHLHNQVSFNEIQPQTAFTEYFSLKVPTLGGFILPVFQLSSFTYLLLWSSDLDSLPIHLFFFTVPLLKRSVPTPSVLHSWVMPIDQTQLIPGLPSSQPLTPSTRFSQRFLLRVQHSVGPSCVEASLSASLPLPSQPHKPQASLGTEHVDICSVYTEREQCGD